MIPECSLTSGTPCKDSSSGKVWSDRSSSTMTWANAKTYCDNLTTGGFYDWHLPSINELRTLITNCSATQTGGSCGITNSCSESSCQNDACTSCTSNNTHSKINLSSSVWSTTSYSKSYKSSCTTSGSTCNCSTSSATYVWYVNFTNANITSASTKSYTSYFGRIISSIKCDSVSEVVSAASHYAICVR